MADFAIEQAVYHRRGSDSPVVVARSSGFLDDWLTEASWLVTGFGDRPFGVSCPGAVFAQPLGKQHVAVVQAADQQAENGAAGVLAFHILALPRKAYENFLGDPFAVARKVPPPWTARGDLPAASWPAEPLPARTVADVRQVLQRVKAGALPEGQDPETIPDLERTVENSESPALLGGVQVLVDGGRLVFERSAPDPLLIQGLWTLLPTTTRSRLWPATFAFGNALGFDAVVVPRAVGDDYEGYTNEDQAAEYPPGRYEFNLQVAAESGDQRELNALLGRRSVAETWRLGVTLLVIASLLALVGRQWNPPAPAPVPAPAPAPVVDREKKAAAAAAVVGVADPFAAAGLLRFSHTFWPWTSRSQP